MLRPFAILLALATGCSLFSPLESATAVVDQALPVACGTCIYKLEGARGCFWSIEVDGEVFPVDGPLPEDHQAHGPEGMCVQPRQAIVSGQVVHGQFQATRFDLLPVDAERDGPTVPHEHVH